MVFDVALVALDELVLARAQVGQRLVVKVNVLLHLITAKFDLFISSPLH